MGGATQFCKYRQKNAVCLIILSLYALFSCLRVDSKYILDRGIIQELKVRCLIKHSCIFLLSSVVYFGTKIVYVIIVGTANVSYIL